MKERARQFGESGGFELLTALQRAASAERHVRFHLMGHSFGARLVAYSLSGLPPAATGAKSPVKTLYLIQGAFSHFAFANPVPDRLVSGPGALSSFIHNVNGPLLSTFIERKLDRLHQADDLTAGRHMGWARMGAERLVVERSSSEQIKAVAVEQGMITLREDGLTKTRMGLTSIEEVARVVK